MKKISDVVEGFNLDEAKAMAAGDEADFESNKESLR